MGQMSLNEPYMKLALARGLLLVNHEFDREYE
jgi:hypothetical protein